jgi:UDP-N-acetylglucosamine--N-acetylmuramyl-(pentapeptide) pyrophosphoryl-undecaprenol N-acetylglucosamine transferase
MAFLEKRKMKVAVACGGTGGHVVPGAVTARVLLSRGHDVALWLSGREGELSAADWAGPVVTVKTRGSPAGFSPAAIPAALQMAAACLSATARMRREAPDVLLGMGSYTSVPAMFAAKTIGVPVVLHEANAVVGRANAAFAKYAAAGAVTFNPVTTHLETPRLVRTGLPLRTDLDGDRVLPGLKPDCFTVLVMGGSQGAHRLNRVVPRAIGEVHEKGTPVQVIHLCGRADEDSVRGAYEKAGVPAQVHAFLKDMGAAYRAADLAVSRAGAASCCELGACGVPTLFVPLPTATRDHQALNADVVRSFGGAEVVEQARFSPNYLAMYLERCIANPAKLERMRDDMARFAVPDAADRLADLVEEVGDR